MVTQPFAFTGTTGNDLVLFTEGSLNTLANTFKGGNPPPNIIAGQLWVDDTNDPTSWLLKLYDGTDHITVASIDPTANTVTPYSGGSPLKDGATGQIGTDIQAFDADTAKTDLVQTFTKQQHVNLVTLADGANIAWDLDNGNVAQVTLAGNRTLDNPTNMKAGGTYVLLVRQDATGSRTLAYGTAYKFNAGEVPVLTTAASAVDMLTFVSDGTSMYGVGQQDFK